MSKNRVVHLTTVHYPYDTRIYHKQCITLANNGFEIFLAAPYHEDITSSKDNTRVKLIPLKKAKNRLTRMTRSVIEIYRVAKNLNADIYHFHDPELIPVGLLLKKRDNIVIYDVHEDYITSIKQKSYIKSKPLRLIIASLFDIFERIFTKNFATCLAEKYYQERFLKGQCILNYPNLNSLEEKAPRPAEQQTKYLLYTGRISEDRGALIHAQIPQIVDDIQVHYLGICSHQLAKKIRIIAGYRSNHVKIDGIESYVPREEMDRKYTERKWLAGLAIFPPTEHYMKKELTKFFEYMYAGLPIICSDFPVWQEFINKHRCGITVDPLNNEEIRNAIQYLRDNPDIAAIMGQNGRKAVIQELNWEKEGQKLVKWYKELIK